MNWFDAEHIVATFGAFAVFAVALIIFFETATILGSVLPGDSLLFILGLTLATGLSQFPFPVALVLLFVAAAGGTQVGYLVGQQLGISVFRRNRGWFFNEKTVERTSDFFARYGMRAVILARFVPVLRAVVPMFAGVGRMNRRQFLLNNLTGALAWSVGVTTAGYLLGQVIWVRQNLELIILSFVVLSSLPFPIELLRHRLRERKTKSAPEA